MTETFATQAEILDLLRSGEWELGYSIGARNDGRYWMQESGLMRGGKTRKVRANTLDALIRRGQVEVEAKRPKDPFWLRRYRLTEQSKERA